VTAERAAVSAATVAERLDEVRARIAQAGGDPAVVRVVAVTKGFGADAVAAAGAAGLVDVGENYAQELLSKWHPGPVWHFLGAVQRNKVGALAAKVAVWQSTRAARRARVAAAGRTPRRSWSGLGAPAWTCGD
jgi:uncharacterized pyridoxal phosphate-containing UPF0001 family protein